MLDNNKDGIDFINIYSKANTQLGKQLTNMFPYSFLHDGIQFNSVEQAWHYYKFININESYATSILNCKNPFDCKKLARNWNSSATSTIVQSKKFKETIQRVIISRLYNDMSLKIMLRNSTLPFEHYFIYDGVVSDQKHKYIWLLDIFDEIRIELQFHYLDKLLNKYGNLCHNHRTCSTNSVYVGRPRSGQIAKYGNPFPISFSIKQNKKSDPKLFEREVTTSVIKYRNYLVNKLKTSPNVWIPLIRDLQGKNLICFCTNGTTSKEQGGAYCHSLILANFAFNLDEILKSI